MERKVKPKIRKLNKLKYIKKVEQEKKENYK